MLRELFWVPKPFKWYQNTSGCGTDILVHLCPFFPFYKEIVPLPSCPTISPDGKTCI